MSATHPKPSKGATASVDAWRLVRSMLDDMTRAIEQDAENALELRLS